MDIDPALARTFFAWLPLLAYFLFMGAAAVVNAASGRKLVNGGLAYLVASAAVFWFRTVGIFSDQGMTAHDQYAAFGYMIGLYFIPFALSLYSALRFGSKKRAEARARS